MPQRIEDLTLGPVTLRFHTEAELGHLVHTETVEFLRFRKDPDSGTVPVFLDRNNNEFTLFRDGDNWCYATVAETVEIVN